MGKTIICKTCKQEKEHLCKGFCRNCYAKYYRQLPENKDRIRALRKAYHKTDRYKETRKAYRNRKDVKEKEKLYSQRPEVKARNRERVKIYSCKPEIKESRKAYNKKWREDNPEYSRLKNKERWVTHKEQESERTKQYHQKNREEILKKMSEYRKKNKDYFKKKWQEYYKNNKKKVLERKKKWNEQHTEHNKLVNKKYYQSSRGKEVVSHNNRLRKIRRRNVKHVFSLEDWKRKVEETMGVCPRCNKMVGIENMTLDHIYPISKVPAGFVYQIEDVQPLCHSCNSSKNNRISSSDWEEIIDYSIEQGLI